MAGEFSFGQLKLLEFAMALMVRPRMLLLDEPTVGINPTLINGVIERLQRANREFGVTLFVIVHNMRVIMTLAEHIHCLAHGRLLASGPPCRGIATVEAETERSEGHAPVERVRFDLPRVHGQGLGTVRGAEPTAGSSLDLGNYVTDN